MAKKIWAVYCLLVAVASAGLGAVMLVMFPLAMFNPDGHGEWRWYLTALVLSLTFCVISTFVGWRLWRDSDEG